MRCLWQVEIDAKCRQVLAKHWPDVTRREDVRDVGRHNLESVDVICGGFPCVDISNAGKRAGITGERSGLWAEFARIIRELRPRYVIVENVAALLVRGMGIVLGDLAEIGYDAEWQCMPAALFGAPHKRDRVFIIAYSQGRNAKRASGCLHTQQPDYPQVWSRLQHKSPGDRATGIMEGWSRRTGRAYTDVLRVADGVSYRVDRIRMMGNAVVPAIAEWLGCRILELL